MQVEEKGEIVLVQIIIEIVWAVLALFSYGQTMTPVLEPVTPAPVPEPAVVAATPAVCPFARPIWVGDPALQAPTARAIERLTEALGCVPFTPGPDGAVVRFVPSCFTDTIDPTGFDWTWVPAMALARPPAMPDLEGVAINPRCWERVEGDWSIIIAHELGHRLGWADMDGHPYMTCPLIVGTYYRADLVVVCGP